MFCAFPFSAKRFSPRRCKGDRRTIPWRASNCFNARMQYSLCLQRFRRIFSSSAALLVTSACQSDVLLREPGRLALNLIRTPRDTDALPFYFATVCLINRHGRKRESPMKSVGFIWQETSFLQCHSDHVLSMRNISDRNAKVYCDCECQPVAFFSRTNLHMNYSTEV